MNDLVKNSNYFPQLTGVRAIAALMVYIHHFNPITEKYFGKYLHNFFREFHIGVTLFFVLSGFLIAYRYMEMNNFNFKKYMVNRIARIYPMYFILTTVTFYLYGYTNDRNDLINYILNISLLKGFFNSFKFSGIAQGWSLTVEETFYILAPLTFMLIKRKTIYLFLLPIVTISFGVVLVIIFSEFQLLGFFSSYEFIFNYTYFGRCSEFFVGIGLAIVFKNNYLGNRFRYFTISGIFGTLLCVYFISLLGNKMDFGIRHPVGKLINTFFLPLVGISIFYYGLLKEKTYISDMLGSKICVLLGKSSYIFYLIHLGIISNTLHSFTSNYILDFAFLVLISIVLFTFIEEPLNILIRKIFTSS